MAIAIALLYIFAAFFLLLAAFGVKAPVSFALLGAVLALLAYSLPAIQAGL